MRLLVVEDEARLAGALQRGLVAEGFAVDVAPDGPQGLDLARHGGYDAMILDVMLPELSGYRVVRQLRAEGNWLPVLMLSAKDGEYDQADGLDCGADDYLTKPFSYVVLLARLRALLRRGAPERPAVLRAGDLVLDPASRQVTLAGAEVALTAREYALLEYLLRRPGQVVQVVDAQQRVRSTSIGADRLVPLLRPDQVAAVRIGRPYRTSMDGAPVGVDGPMRVVAVRAGPPHDPQTVIVAQSVRDIQESFGLLRTALLVVYPLLLLALGLVGWRVVGAALRPVEALRAGAEAITGTGAADRLPVPAAHDEVGRLA